MVADIRSVSTASRLAYGFSTGVAKPEGARAGDILICLHSTDSGSLFDMGISGGGVWTTIATANDLGSGGAKVYRKIVSSSDPSEYTLEQPASANSTAIVIAIKGGQVSGLTVDKYSDSGSIFGIVFGVRTPAAAPSTGSGLELRIGSMFDLDSSRTGSWSTPTGGYSTPTSTQASNDIASVMVSKTLVSTSSLPAVTISGSRSGDYSYGFTIIVPSSSSTTPDVPKYNPVRGSGLYRYTVHDFLTSAYMTDIFPADVSFDRRIGEPGTFSARIDVTNASVAEQMAAVVPRHSSDLTSGPGRIVVHVWRAGILWGVYWITGARISKSRRGNISVELRGSTLDAFFDNVPVETSLTYSSDQVANARSLLAHMQTLSGANIGLQLQSGTSGQTRTLSVKTADEKTYGSALSDFAKAYNGFEYVVDPTINTDTGEVERWWKWGYPKLSTATVHTFTESPHGGEILEWGEEIDALRGATRIRVRGGTPEVTDAEVGSSPVYSSWYSATTHMTAGWPRIGQRIDHPGESLSTSELNDYASRWIAAMAGAVRVYSCTVALGANTTVSPSSLGDQIRRIMVNEWHPREEGAATFNTQQRLIGIAITPVSRQTGKEEAQLILEEPTISAVGTSGDRFPVEQRRAIRRLQQENSRLSRDAKQVKGIPVPTADNVSNPPNFSSPSVQSGEFASGSAYTALRSDAAALHDTVRDLMNSMRNNGLLR